DRITDDGRIRGVIPTLTALRESAADVIVCAHLGRPKGAPDPKYSLAPVARRLGELLGVEVEFASDTVGPQAEDTVDRLVAGSVALLENLRFNPGETSKDDAERAAFAERLAGLADVYVDDAFGAVHRKHASVYDVAKLLPHYAGRLVTDEVAVLRELTESPQRPYVVALGGAKVSDKLAVIANLLDKVDRLLIGGGMMFTFLAAQGHSTGASLLEADQIDQCRGFVDEAEKRGVELVLPVDTVVGDRFAADATASVVDVSAIPEGAMGLDIGPRTRELFAGKLADARTVFWNGPMGVFEFPAFAQGTKTVAQSLVDSTGLTVVGGGDSAAAVRTLGLDENGFSHISTGGGASLEFLEGKTLPGLSILES
ncbi:MAG: phosphoglycerate kinase, partial [Stackebrandtia sp.]